jgi:hypothetical protein
MPSRPRVSVSLRACACALACAGAVILFTLAGCKTPPSFVAKGETSVRLETSSNSIAASVEEVQQDAETIIEESSSARSNIEKVYSQVTETQREPLAKALTSVQEIDARADNIVSETTKVIKETETLETVQDQVESLELEVAHYKSATSMAQAQALQQLYAYINLFWVIGFAAIAAGAAIAFFANKTFGGTISIIGVLMIVFASASQYYMEEIAFTGAVILIGSFLVGLLMIAWSTVRGKNHDQAIKEIVELIEILKETMTEEERDRIFGEKGLASEVQSDLTKRIIERVREKNGFLRLKEIKNSHIVRDSDDDTEEQ